MKMTLSKNLWVLATSQPSRLYKDLNNKINITDIEMKSGNKQHIYITSDEEIKRIDYWLNIDNNIISNGEMFELANDAPSCKKIILTTDKDLIKDGVQAIDDDFLEWFVKNPSCEEVEVKMNQGRYFDYGGNVHITNAYKIIIPNKEALKGSMSEAIKQVITKQDNKWPESTGDINSDYFIAQSKAIQKCMLLDAEMAYNSLPKKESIEEVGMYQQELFNYLHDLGAIALQSEMQEIERIVLKNSNINTLNFEIDALKRQIKVLKRHKDQIYNKIKELYNNQNITGFYKRPYAQCLDIVEQFKKRDEIK